MERTVIPNPSGSCDDYMAGAIDGLLSVEQLPEYETTVQDGSISLNFHERVPLKAFINIYKFIKQFGVDEQLWIVPSEDGVIIKYSK